MAFLLGMASCSGLESQGGPYSSLPSIWRGHNECCKTTPQKTFIDIYHSTLFAQMPIEFMLEES